MPDENPIEPVGDAAKGGRARADKLNPEQRREIARKAAEARWNADIPQATHEGEFSLGGKTISAAVIPGGKRLLAQGTYLMALGRSRTPKAGTGALTAVDGLPFFLQHPSLKPFIDKELLASTTPVFFLRRNGTKAVGYDAESLPAVAEAYLKVRDDCTKRKVEVPKQIEHIVTACDILTRSLARLGIVALVDEATGYQYARPLDDLRKLLEKYISKELAKWVLTFQLDFYKEIYRLRGWKLEPSSNRKPGVVAKYTVNLVYDRIHPDLAAELKKTRAAWEDTGGKKHGKLWQFTTPDYGHPRLKQHIEGVIMIARFSKDWKQFLHRMDVAYPRINHNRLIAFPEPEEDEE
jgi:hypothetical protein